MVPALLILSLVCLLLGILFAASGWLIGSVAASVVAAVVLYHRRSRSRTRVRTRAARDASAPPSGAVPAPVAAALVTGAAFGAARGATGSAAPVVEARPDVRVWVVDGRPAYHLGQCPILDDVPAGTLPERIALAQALEDGFVACVACDPTDERLAAGSRAVVAAAEPSGPDDVWVVDGRPRFHRPGCAVLTGEDAEAIPPADAVADGFIPCPVCQPEPQLD